MVEGAPPFCMPTEWQKPKRLSLADFRFCDATMQRVQKGLIEGSGIKKQGPIFEEKAMANPLLLSMLVASGSKQEMRQPKEVWGAFRRVLLPWMDKDFVYQTLWKKLAVGSRLHAIFPQISPWCPFDYRPEDHYHRVKSCQFLQVPWQLMRDRLPSVKQGDTLVEMSRLCWDEPFLSLTTPQGLLAWKVVRTLWVFRCDVLFGRTQSTLEAFMTLLYEALGWWLKEEVLSVPKCWTARFQCAVQGWLQGVQCPHVQLPLLDGPLLVMVRKRKRPREWVGNEQGDPPGGQEPGFDHGIKVKRVFTDGSFAWEVPGVGFAGSGVHVEGDPLMGMALPLPGDYQPNNRAEMFAVLKALEDLPQDWALCIHSDSSYVVNGCNQFLKQWKANGWRTSGRKMVANQDLWLRLEELGSQRVKPWVIKWTQGHVGLVGNERADALANQGRLAHPGRQVWLQRAHRSLTWVDIED